MLPSKPRNPCGKRTSTRIPGSHPDAAGASSSTDPGIFHGIERRDGANAISMNRSYHDWGWFIAPIEMVFYFGWFMNYLPFTTLFLIKVDASQRHQLPPAKVSVHQDPQYNQKAEPNRSRCIRGATTGRCEQWHGSGPSWSLSRSLQILLGSPRWPC